MKRRILALSMSLLLVGGIFAGCGEKDSKQEEDTQKVQEENTDSVTIRIGGMSGPTSMGMVKLMEDSENGIADNTYEFAELATEASAFVAPLAKGEIDIAAVPSNLAATVYNNTEQSIQVLAVNTLGVLNIVTRDEQVTSIADLSGKTIYATGQGATPEYTLRYILKGNDLDPEKDVTIQWCADTTEAMSYLTKDEKATAMLPQPFATVAQTQVEGLSVVADLNEEWAKINDSCEIVTGVVVARKEFVEEHPQAVEAFLKEYEASIKFTENDPEKTAQFIEKYIGLKAAVAQKALPNCHIVYLAGEEMRNALEGYLKVLFEQNAKAIGGAMPGEDFYYGL